MTVADEVEAIAGVAGFSGVVSVSRGEQVEFERGYGLADRAHAVPVGTDTMFGIASATKGLTALAVMNLIEDGSLHLNTAARSVLGTDLPLIADDVTVEQLLAHTSGIGDYVDEDADTDVDDYQLAVPTQRLSCTEDYLAVLDGHQPKFAAGQRFCYCNGSYVVLALMAERVSGRPFPELVLDRVFRPAGMVDSGFPRSDALPGRAAIGYLTDRVRSNVFHLPVVGSGDGGAYSTVADFRNLWLSLFAGCIVAPEMAAEMVRPRNDVPTERMRYGLGFWLSAAGPAVILEGYDAGVSFRSVHDPESARTYTVISNTSDGAWPIAARLAALQAG